MPRPRKRRERRYRPSEPPRVMVRRLPMDRVEINRGLAWYAIWTAPKAEQRILDQLRENGVTAYLPSEAFETRRRNRVVEVRRPAVSRYVFVGLNAAQPDFGAVFNALGDWPGLPRFGRLLMVAGEPLRVPAAALQRLADGLVVLDIRQPWLSPGGRFLAKDGPFSGFVGIVQDSDDARVRGLLDLFGRRTVVEFEPWQLEAAA